MKNIFKITILLLVLHLNFSKLLPAESEIDTTLEYNCISPSSVTLKKEFLQKQKAGTLKEFFFMNNKMTDVDTFKEIKLKDETKFWITVEIYNNIQRSRFTIRKFDNKKDFKNEIEFLKEKNGPYDIKFYFES